MASADLVTMKILLRIKDRPVHKYRPSDESLVQTWCGTDPYRKGVKCEGHEIGIEATCQKCLEESRRAQPQPTEE